MNKDTRRFAIFIVVGLLIAAFVGVGVWRVSTPANPSSKDTAMTDEVSSTTSSTDLDTSTQSTKPKPVTSDENTTSSEAPTPRKSSKKAKTNVEDPFLAPHAQVQAQGPATAPEPTVYYRPDSVGGVGPHDSNSYGEGAAPAPGSGVAPAQEPTQDTPGGTSGATSVPETPGSELPTTAPTTDNGTTTPPNAGGGGGPVSTSPETPGTTHTKPTRDAVRGDTSWGKKAPQQNEIDEPAPSRDPETPIAPTTDKVKEPAGRPDSPDISQVSDPGPLDKSPDVADPLTGVQVPEEPAITAEQPAEPVSQDSPVTDRFIDGDSNADESGLDSAAEFETESQNSADAAQANTVEEPAPAPIA